MPVPLLRACRVFRNEPGFAWPVVVALAVGIAASTSVFSIFSAMFLSPNGFRNADRVITLWATDPAHAQDHVEASYRDLQGWRVAADTFSDAALVSSVNLDFRLYVNGEPFNTEGATVSGSFFRLAGTKPFAGRLLNDADDTPNSPLNAVLSYTLWRTRFGADPNLVGTSVRFGTDSATIIGIAPPEFDFPRDVGVWITIHASWPKVEENLDARVFRGIARLVDGADPSSARTRLAYLAQLQTNTLPASAGRYGVAVTPLTDEIFGSAKPAVRILLGAVLLVLLIGCANAANLLLARANARASELAVRLALGAGRAHLVSLLFMEAAILGACAGALGLALAAAATRVIAGMAPPDIPGIATATLDLRVLFFCLVATGATILLFGLAPAFLASRQDPGEGLKLAGRAASGGSSAQALLRKLLIVSEVAFTTFLLIGAGLLARSYSNMTAVDPGFRSENILTFRVTTELAEQESRRRLYTQLLDRLRRLPGVESAAAVLIRPLSGTVGWDTTYTPEGQAESDRRRNPNGNLEAISPEYFHTLGIRLLAGRDFTAADDDHAPPVVIINESTARRHWPDGNAVGHRLRLGGGPRALWATIAGVVHDVRYREWEAARPDFYVPYLQRAQHRTDFVLKTHGDPSALAESVRRAVLAVDPAQPISNVTTLSELADRAMARSRFNAAMLGGLAVSALLLAAFGIYSVLSYMVSQTAFEIAVRSAMGALPRQVAALVAGRGLRLVLGGGCLGLGAAAIASHLLNSLLYGVAALDALTYTAAAAILLGTAVTATLRPAARAAAIDPMQTLRSGG